MSADSFAILLACVAFVLGVACGLYIGEQRNVAARKGKPVSDRRLSRLHVVEHEPTERQHLTISRRASYTHIEDAP